MAVVELKSITHYRSHYPDFKNSIGILKYWHIKLIT
jgi:hypothetical protein